MRALDLYSGMARRCVVFIGNVVVGGACIIIVPYPQA